MKQILRNVILVVVFFIATNCIAQVKNEGQLYVADNAEMHVFNGDFDFSSLDGQTSTSRTNGTHGVLSFSSTASWINASDTHFLDGYARTYSQDFFTLPTGQSGVFAPIAVDAISTLGVDGAYYRQTPTSSSSHPTTINDVSEIEYWHLVGENAKVSLTWRSSSNLSFLTASNLANLTIVGWDGNEWLEIPSTVDINSILGGTSDLSAGSITSDSEIDLQVFSYVTFGSKESCAPMIVSNGVEKTWDGSSWTPSGAPTLENPVVINGDFSGTLQCNSIVLNANVILNDGEYLEIVNGSSGSGKVVMSSEASLVQRSESAQAPTIELTKKTRPMKRWDYVYWGTPIEGNFLAQLNGAVATGYTLQNAFDLRYKWVSGPPPGNLWQTLDAITTGKGFITRIRAQVPFNVSTYLGSIDLKLIGIANNGDINVPVAYNPSCLNCRSSHNLLANPYPSAIDAGQFLKENESIEGAVYLWTAASTTGNAGSNTQADFAVWNLAGSVNTSPIAQQIDGRIASGQGFQVKALTNGSVTFTNCMRLVEDNNNFFRMSEQETVKDRFKLTLTNNNDVFSQIQVAYLEDATLGYDRLYDAGRNSSSSSQLYSLLNTVDGRRLSIDGRPTFFVEDVVPVGVSKETTNSEQFSIAINDREGIFSTDDVLVFLHDKELNTYHNFQLGSYQFTLNEQVTNERFEIVYQDVTLGNGDFVYTRAFANLKSNLLNVRSTDLISTVNVFDVSGRLVVQFSNVSKNSFESPFYHAEGVYIIKIELEDGEVVTQKLINSINY